MNFDGIAPFYERLETISFGRALQRARTRWLAQVAGSQRALIVGEGNGRFICELLRISPELEVDCVEASGRMIELARRRLAQSPADSTHVRFYRADILAWSPPGEYDLIVTHFVLDCFDGTELEMVVTKLANAAEPGAKWLLADFRVPERGELRIPLTKIWIRLMYLFFRITAGLRTAKLVDPSPYLRAAGFGLTNETLTHGGMIKSQVWRRIRGSALVSSAGDHVP